MCFNGAQTNANLTNWAEHCANYASQQNTLALVDQYVNMSEFLVQTDWYLQKNNKAEKRCKF